MAKINKKTDSSVRKIPPKFRKGELIRRPIGITARDEKGAPVKMEQVSFLPAKQLGTGERAEDVFKQMTDFEIYTELQKQPPVPYATPMREIIRRRDIIGQTTRSLLSRGVPEHVIGLLVPTKGNQWTSLDMDKVGKFDRPDPQVMKEFNDCITYISDHETYGVNQAWERLVEFVAATFGIAEFPKMKMDTYLYLFENFPIQKMRERKSDYFGMTELNNLNSNLGQFFTPAGIGNLLAQMSNVNTLKPGQSCLDPALGSGGLLLASMDEAKPGVMFYGIELSPRVYNAAVVNMFLYCPILNPFFVINANALTDVHDWSKANIFNPREFARVGSISENVKENRNISKPLMILEKVARNRTLMMQIAPNKDGEILISPIQRVSPKYYEPSYILKLLVEMDVGKHASTKRKKS